MMEMRNSEAPIHTEILLRKQDNAKGPLKEKFVAVYEAFFMGEDPSKGNPAFWDELFLLKVNVSFLERCILSTQDDHILQLRPNLNMIFKQCAITLSDESFIRKSHAIETLSVLFKGFFAKKYQNFGSEVVDLICGIQSASNYFNNLLATCARILDDPKTTDSMKASLLNMLCICVTATENINQNSLIEYFILNDIFDSLFRIILETKNKQPSPKSELTLFLLTCLINYNKYEAKNPYLRKFSQICSSNEFDLVSEILTKEWSKVNQACSMKQDEPKGVLSRMVGMFGFYAKSPVTAISLNPSGIESLDTLSTLLAFYEMVSSNPLFAAHTISSISRSLENPTNGATVDSAKGDITKRKSLMQQFLEFASYTIIDVQDANTAMVAKICLLIFQIMIENINLAKQLHDPELGLLPRPTATAANAAPTEKRPLICTMIDLVVKFLSTNLKKNMHANLYRKGLGFIHRVLCFEKQNRLRLKYRWKRLWDALFLAIKFLGTPDLLSDPEIVEICNDIAALFNLFITYGDTFLPGPSDYDELYYELIRMQKLLDHFYQTAQTCDKTRQLGQNLDNIRTIIKHFSGKLDQWQNNNPGAILTQDQVIDVIRNNYDSLKLNLLDNIDHYELYMENPREVQFFRTYTRYLISYFRKSTSVLLIDLPIS